jgi:spermidine synthase
VVVRRDHVATVVACGEGHHRLLLVNGTGMTSLTPITKFMVHLPLACHKEPPKSALVICFGMGTSYRAAVSWGIDTTAVELVPSVPRMFGFYHADADRYANATNGHIVIDDGRRFLKRTAQNFDVIIVDPPPPVYAAGSSLLFSKEFYDAAKQHLNPGGILQMWYPDNPNTPTGQATMRSIWQSFPCVRGFVSVEGTGMHLLASREPIESASAAQLVARMPAAARQDLIEWYNSTNAPAVLDLLLHNEFSVSDALNPDASIRITDDEPFNEYFLLRRWLGDTKNGF